jgi:4-hydroxy-2-oxoheptanedioate aldolase
MYINTFKRERRQQIGFWLSLTSPYSAELCATAGFDWLLIDSEHAPNNVQSILQHLQAVAAYRSHPVVRPLNADPGLIKQLLDIGTQSLLVPMIDTAEHAQAVVAAVRYPPRGIRGVGAAVARASRWGDIGDYLDRADEETCILVQVETAQALRNIDSICAVDGIDGVFIGPADLAASMGHRGKPTHPEVQRAIDDAIARIAAQGKAAGTLTSDLALAERYLELGCTFVAAGIDARVLAEGARKLAAQFLDEQERQAAFGRTYAQAGRGFPVTAEYTLELEDIGTPTEGENREMWDELTAQAQRIAQRICANLPGTPVVDSVDAPQVNETAGSLWHMKVRFNMRCE